MPLLDCLAAQTKRPDLVVIIGVEPSDVVGVEHHDLSRDGRCVCLLSSPGVTGQRNKGLDYVAMRKQQDACAENCFCVFFDDDFRPCPDWLEKADERFEKGDIVGLTGQPIADGVLSGGISEDDARAIIDGRAPVRTHWQYFGDEERTVVGLYGCNMAFLDTVASKVRFDEALPLYGWLEDRDYSFQCSRYGRIIYYPDCHGVHLGTPSGGRTNGRRLGFSQIMNPVYFFEKGTMSTGHMLFFVAKYLSSNLLHGLRGSGPQDYHGRLRGNLLAFADILRGRINPGRATQL